MKKLSIFSLFIPLLLAIVFAFHANTAKAQSVSCASASQTCYEVYVSGIKVKTVSGKAQIRL
ncbi:MAG: hypothetical protein HEQ40_00705 [Lacibacter sp.]